MKTDRFKTMLIVFVVLLFAGCAGQQVKTDMSAFTPVALEGKGFTLKADNFLVIMDTSASMNELYKGDSKFSLEKGTIDRMNRTIAGLDLKGALRAFGQGRDTTLLYGLTDYTASGLKEGLVKASYADGNSPLYAAINYAKEDLQSTSGPIALIIFSDAKEMDKTLAINSAKGIKEAFGDRICIYTVLIGDDETGRKLMKEISEVGSCGFATDADSIFSARDMADFSREVFLGDRVKSWVLTGIEFEFASAAITSDSRPILDKALKVLKDNPSVKVRIEGHTDNIGSESYNQILSENRAKAVMNYFIEKGVSANRLSSVGYGYTRPVSGNETAEGRNKNRRVELITVK